MTFVPRLPFGKFTGTIVSAIGLVLILARPEVSNAFCALLGDWGPVCVRIASGIVIALSALSQLITWLSEPPPIPPKLNGGGSTKKNGDAAP